MTDSLNFQIAALLKKAPPPSYCQAPVTAGMHSAACICAAPLRLRVKPYPTRNNERLVCPIRRAKASLSSPGPPVIAEAHSVERVSKCPSIPFEQPLYPPIYP